jgi:hypothetical protein
MKNKADKMTRKQLDRVRAQIDKAVTDPDYVFVSANHWDALEPLFREAQEKHGVKP